jgi:hypothetical protein
VSTEDELSVEAELMHPVIITLDGQQLIMMLTGTGSGKGTKEIVEISNEPRFVSVNREAKPQGVEMPVVIHPGGWGSAPSEVSAKHEDIVA